MWDPCYRKGLLGSHLNVRSLASKGEQIEHLLINSNIDFMGLSETWLSLLSPETIITMPGYNTFRKDRLEGKGGDVLLSVKSHLKCHQLELPTEIQFECIGVNITLSASTSFIVICIYGKPTRKVDFYDQLKKLCNLCERNHLSR